LKKVKASISPQKICYPVYSEEENECYFSPFFKRGVERRILTKSKDLLHQSIVTECDGQWIDASPFYGMDECSSDEEMVNKKIVGDVPWCKWVSSKTSG
jgi:hypothetical protein